MARGRSPMWHPAVSVEERSADHLAAARCRLGRPVAGSLTGHRSLNYTHCIAGLLGVAPRPPHQRYIRRSSAGTSRTLADSPKAQISATGAARPPGWWHRRRPARPRRMRSGARTKAANCPASSQSRRLHELSNGHIGQRLSGSGRVSYRGTGRHSSHSRCRARAGDSGCRSRGGYEPPDIGLRRPFGIHGWHPLR